MLDTKLCSKPAFKADLGVLFAVYTRLMPRVEKETKNGRKDSLLLCFFLLGVAIVPHLVPSTCYFYLHVLFVFLVRRSMFCRVSL